MTTKIHPILTGVRRMKTDDRFNAVLAAVSGAAAGSERDRPILHVTYRRWRGGELQTQPMVVVGVARNDNGTSFGELIIQRSNDRMDLYGVSLANITQIGVEVPA